MIKKLNKCIILPNFIYYKLKNMNKRDKIKKVMRKFKNDKLKTSNSKVSHVNNT